MSIKSIEITQLFGTFNHKIEFSKDDDLTILLGQNGIGKTAILRLLNMIFNHQLSRLTGIPFQEAVIEFYDSKKICIALSKGTIDNVLDYDISNGEFLLSTSCNRIAEKIKDALKSVRNYVSENFKNDDEIWIDRNTGEWMTSEELIWKCYEEHPHLLIDVEDIYPVWLYQIIDECHLLYIQTQRLQTDVYSVNSSRVVSRNQLEHQNTLRLFANEMKTRLQKLQQDYGQKAAELDQSYPYRLVDNFDDLVFSKAELTSSSKMLDELDEKREQLVEAGLLNRTQWQSRQLNTNFKSAYALKAITLYISDSEEKFSIFNDELKRIELFRNLINDRFLKKEIMVNALNGFIVRSTITGAEIPLEKLSSGEQHLLVQFFSLIYRLKEGTVVLIDEPEISLHVSWQKRYISEMMKIIKLNKMKVIIATHSPTLIGKYWGVTKELDKNIEVNAEESKK